MYNKQQAEEQIITFLKSSEKCLLITGTHQYEKHKLIMRILNKCYRNAHVLFRTNALGNVTNNAFIDLSKQPRAGKNVKIGNNYYQFDSFNKRVLGEGLVRI
jgi:hypothetical protein